MGIFSKLFGRKKKEEQKPVGEKAAKPSEPSDEVSLEDVNESLEEVNTIQKDAPKETEVKKETPAAKSEEPATSAATEEPQTPEEEPEEAAETEEDNAVYDIKKHTDGWQVIKEGADKAYRVFEYQKQAIDFAKQEDLEYRVFKADGTPRK